MKKLYKGLIAGFAALSMLAFTSCEDILNAIINGDSDDGFSGTIVEATDDLEWDYAEDGSVLYVDSSVKSVTVTNVPANKKMYLVKRNVSHGLIVPASATRAVTGAYRSALAEDSELSQIDVPESQFKHFVPEELPTFTPSASRSAVAAPSYSVTPVNGAVGDKKNIWVQLSSGYVQKPATIRAVGTNCYVWVIEDYYSTTASGNKVNTTIAQKYATSFDSVYPYIRNVFGVESEKIADKTTNQYVDISSLSDTGSKVNIVVYDIKDEGVLGFFYSKDYYYGPNSTQDIIRKSNVGKYFYIDSEYANSEFDETIGTLAHEFQHMINFNQKNILHGTDNPSAGYNEMLSMLCEDMMQSKLGFADSKGPKGRLQSFNAYYWLAGITGYNGTKNTSLYYSTNYAFGAWLARQYGGAKLVKAMSQNEYINNESIVDAVNSVNGTDYDFDELFVQFLLALTGSSTYTMNKAAAQSINYSGYSYPMTTIDIWHDNYSLRRLDEYKNSVSKYKYADYSWYGPFQFSSSVTYPLQPENGISIHCLGTTTAGSKTLTFTNGADCMKLYLIIQ